jgi:hypothetical protein
MINNWLIGALGCAMESQKHTNNINQQKTRLYYNIVGGLQGAKMCGMSLFKMIMNVFTKI